MRLETHVKTGCLMGLLLAPFWGVINSIFFFLGAVLIDADHALDFLWRTGFKRFWDIKYVFKGTNIWAWVYLDGPERKNLITVFPFHTVEFLIIVLTGCLIAARHNLTFLSSALFGFFCGALFHITLDIVFIKIKKIPKAWSLIEYAIRKRKFPNQNRIYQEMLYKLKQDLTK